jgi:hypothetical protein
LEDLLLEFKDLAPFPFHLVDLTQQLLTLAVLLAVELSHSLLDLVHGVQSESVFVYWIDQLFESVVVDLNRLFYLLDRHHILKVIVAVVTVIVLVATALLLRARQ